VYAERLLDRAGRRRARRRRVERHLLQRRGGARRRSIHLLRFVGYSFPRRDDDDRPSRRLREEHAVRSASLGGLRRAAHRADRPQLEPLIAPRPADAASKTKALPGMDAGSAFCISYGNPRIIALFSADCHERSDFNIDRTCPITYFG